MDDHKLIAQLKRHEGSVIMEGRHVVYDDATGERILPTTRVQGWATVGYGRNLVGRGLSDAEAETLLANDIENFTRECCHAWPTLFQTEALDDVRQAAVINMAFNMGIRKLLGFRKMFAAIERRDYEDAAMEARDSAWGRQPNKRRVDDVCYMLRTGQWPREAHAIDLVDNRVKRIPTL